MLTHFLGVMEDITEKKKYEEKLSNAVKKIEAADKMKNEFLAQISHEIRTPLNIILNSANLIKVETEDRLGEEYLKLHDFILNAGKRLIRTFDLLLDLSQLQMDHFEPELSEKNLYAIVLKAADEYKPDAVRKGLNFNFTSGISAARVWIDEYSTLQIFRNLLDNAVKFTESGAVNIYMTEHADEIRVKISDTGIGMSEKYLKDIFNLFSQEDTGYKRRYEGNGLGLALVKRFVDINGAFITVSSKKGKGSSFTVVYKKNPVSSRPVINSAE